MKETSLNIDHNISICTKDYQKENKRSLFLSWTRVLYFLAYFGLLIYFANERAALNLGITLFIGGAIFAVLIKAHIQQKKSADIAFEKLQFYNLEQDKTNSNWKNHIDTGQDFNDVKHPYSNDLDLFGKGSIFQLINKTITEKGRTLLADRLKNGVPPQQATQIQESVLELEGHLDNIAKWWSVGQARKNKTKKAKNEVEILESLNIPKLSPLLIGVTFIAIALFLSTLFGWGVLGWKGSFIGLSLLFNGVILAFVNQKIKDSIPKIQQILQHMGVYAEISKVLEKENFNSHYLKNLSSTLKIPVLASKALSELSSISHQLDARANPYYLATVDLFFLVDVYTWYKLQKWQSYNDKQTTIWENTIAEFEVLWSLSLFKAQNPSFTFPEFSNEELEFTGEEIGHPLIREKRVCNNFTLNQKGQLVLITGSNMAGKSTFLRSLGVNIILANMGAPICGKSLKISKFQLFTSMRISDSLDESVSAFYAELKRIKQLLEYSRSNTKVFYMLDEVLKGTNSQDRYMGIKTVIDELTTQNTIGLISTHDLSLSKLEESYDGKIKNYCFNSYIDKNEITFPYKIEAGICSTYSAYKLMERIGIIQS